MGGLRFSEEAILSTVAEHTPPTELLTIQAAAERLGVHTWALRRAVKRGDVPSYRGFNSRRLVRLSEVLATIEATRLGGGQ
jgi:excisionase family DNA binding protein